jgi:hypothetical protein
MKNDDVLKILHQRHRRSLWLPVLLVAVPGALAALLVLVLLAAPGRLFQPEPAKLLAWLGVLAASGLAAGGTFWLRRRSLARTAAEWDREIQGKNRLEAAAELASSESPLARAQREESGQYLTRSGGLRRSWLVPVLAGGVAVLVLLQFLLVTAWMVDLALHGWPTGEVAQKKNPQARFTWVKPNSEIKASPLEEVPLTAQATSSTGLEKVSLEISVNGSAKKLSVPIEESVLSQPGENRLELSVFLDELEAEPFDIVSYHLQGRRIAAASLPAVASDLQFIQVRPLRDEALERDAGEGKGRACLKLLLKLKIAQLGLLKGNHVLATAELERTSPAWTGENARVGDEQDALAGKTREAVDFFIANDAPLQAVDWLKQAVPEMETAGRSIQEIKNPAAVPHQEKALSLITACEKLFIKVVVRKGSPGQKDNLKDPFQDEQRYQLTKRQETPAGELEELARKQAELNEEMSSPSSSGAAGEKTARQAAEEKKIAEKLGGLAGSLPEDVSDSLRAAQAKAGEAAEHLEAGDPGAGAQAGTETLARMQQALASLRAAGEAAAADKLAAAQQDLNQAAAQAAQAEKGQSPGENATGAAGQMAKAREDLKAEADRQQREGSAEAAQRLADLVNRLNEQGVGKQLREVAQGTQPGKDDEEGPSASEKLSELAREAGKGSLASLADAEARKKTAEELARASRLLKRLTESPDPSGTGAGSTAEVLEHLKAHLQNAESVVQAPDRRDQAAKIRKNIPDRTPGLTSASVVVFYQTNHDKIEELIVHLLASPSTESRQNAFTVMSETEVSEPYREPVARYFEELSQQDPGAENGTP